MRTTRCRAQQRAGRLSAPATLRIACAGLLLCVAACADKPQPPSFPFANLILISIDTLRADHLGAYGYGRPTSPTLDRLAREGIVFEQAISQATWTLPSHAALMTSRYPSELGLSRWPSPGRVPEQAVTLAETLEAAGLTTWGFTEWAWLSARYGLNQGFELYDDRGGLFRHIMPRLWGRLPELRDTRFFVFLHTYDAHWYQPEAASQALLVRPYDGALTPSEDLRTALQRRKGTPPDRFNTADLNYIVDLYDASIRDVDRHIARLVERLEALGLWEDTLLVITSDHGEEFLDHGFTGHGYAPWDEQVHVPLIIRLPGGQLGGRRIAAQVRLIDVMPTLLELLDIPSTAAMRGASLVPLMTAPPSDDDSRLAFTDRGHRGLVSLRTPDWKLIYDTGSHTRRAYRLRDDPAETHDRYSEDLAELRPLQAELEKWLAELELEPAVSEPTPQLSEEEREQLRSLGYLDDP